MKRVNKMKNINKCSSITEQEKNLLYRCRNAIQKISPTAKVILYGSRARGDAETESDYDLLILVNDSVNLEKEHIFRKQIYPIELETGWIITVNVYSYTDWNSPIYKAMPFRQNVEKEGIFI
jgi:predicted nucleotidyltransferase